MQNAECRGARNALGTPARDILHSAFIILHGGGRDR
jgi:hypothetical protein